MSFPSNFSEITVEYLNKVLEPIFNSKIISFTQGSPIEPGFTGEIIRIIPEYENKSENNLPKCFIIKFQTSNKGINKFMTKIKGYEKEQKIYEILKPYEKELNLPKIYYTNINEEGNKYIIIMEDLKERGLYNINRDKFLDLKILKLIVEYFALLQSHFWGPDNLKKIEWIKDYNFASYMKEFTVQNFDKKKLFFINNNKALLNDNLINEIKNIKINELYEKIDPDSEKNKNRITLLHGDPQQGNLMVNEEKNIMAMIDWQYINIGLGLKDVILFIGISLDENSIKKEDIIDLKNLYYNILVNKGIQYDKKAFEEDWKNICLISLCNIVSASAEENIGDDEEKKKKYGEHIMRSEKRFITFIQLQNL